MNRKIRIYESDIKKAIKKTIKEQYEMGDAYRRSPKHGGKFKKLPREKGIEGVFGVYGEEMPPAIIRYMRKNPKYIIQRLYDLYGKEVFDKYLPKDDYVGKMLSKGEFEYDDDDDFKMNFEEDLIDEVEDVSGKKYNLKDPNDLLKFNKDIDNADPKKINVGSDVGEIMNEEYGRFKLKTLKEYKKILKNRKNRRR